MLTPKEKLIKARVLIMKENSYWGYILLHFDFREDNSIDTIGVDQNGNCYFNPRYVSRQPIGYLKFVLKHEARHLILQHHLREKHRNKLVMAIQNGKPVLMKLWNIACDYAVNLQAFEEGEDTPPEALINEKFRGKCAEEIYDILEQYLRQKPTVNLTVGFNDKHLWSDREGKSWSGKIAKEAKDWTRIASEARTFAEKSKGELPAATVREIDQLLEPRLSWRMIVRNAISEKLSNDVTWRKPSRRSRALEVYLPSKRKKETLKVAIAVDTSGSMSEDELRRCLTEIKGLFTEFDEVEAILMDCDTQVYNLWEIDSLETLLDKLKEFRGGGGTDFRPVFKKLTEIKPRLLLFFTDLYGDFPKEKPDYEVIWIVPSAIDKESYQSYLDKARRIGEVITID